MLMLRYFDYNCLHIVLVSYPPLLEFDDKIYVKAKFILPRHIFDVNTYPSKANLDLEQQQERISLPYNGGLNDPSCVKPKVT